MNREFVFQVDGLESRRLLSGYGFHGGFGHFGGLFGGHEHGGDASSDPTVAADLQKIKDDRQKLETDRQTLAPTLKADAQAIHDAIDGLDSTLAPLKQTLKDDAGKWRDTIKTDFQTLYADRGDDTKV